MKLSVDLISTLIPVLHLTDTGAKGLALMEDFKVSHLPVVENGTFIGLVSENDFLDERNANLPLSNCSIDFDTTFISPELPIFDVVSTIVEGNYSLVAVVDKNKKYLGSISRSSLLKGIADSSTFVVPGGTVVLSMGPNDYSLSQIAQIVESNNAKILGLQVLNVPDSLDIEVVLKVNTEDVTSIVSTFNRYSYNIVGLYGAVDNNVDLMDERYDQLVKFLNT